MVEFYLLTFPRFPLRKKEHNSYFGKNRTHDFRTSRCAAYLLDHSSDEVQGGNSNDSKIHGKKATFPKKDKENTKRKEDRHKEVLGSQ